MELQKQVVSLELAKQLKELGLKQDSLFWWFKTTYYNNVDEYVIRIKQPAKWSEQISAFTVGELGEMLPKGVTTEKLDNCFLVTHHDLPTHYEYNKAENEADARAKMLIYLLEKKLITL